MKGTITLLYEGGYFTVTERMKGMAPKRLYYGQDAAEAKRILDEAVKGC